MDKSKKKTPGYVRPKVREQNEKDIENWQTRSFLVEPGKDYKFFCGVAPDKKAKRITFAEAIELVGGNKEEAERCLFFLRQFLNENEHDRFIMQLEDIGYFFYVPFRMHSALRGERRVYEGFKIKFRQPYEIRKRRKIERARRERAIAMYAERRRMAEEKLNIVFREKKQ